MKTTYNSYSTESKWTFINGINLNALSRAPRSTKNYWKNKGREKIKNAISKKESFQFNDIESLKSNFSEIIKQSFAFFLSIIDQKKQTLQTFKKSKAKMSEMISLLEVFMSTEEICVIFRISRRTLFNLKRNLTCKKSVTRECFGSSPNQLSQSEIQIICERYFNNPVFEKYRLSNLYAKILSDKTLYLSKSRFYDLAKQMGESEKRKPKCIAKQYCSLKAKQPKEILQMDKTHIRIKDSGPLWLNLIIDNFSRVVLGFTFSRSSSSSITLKNFKGVIKEHKLENNNFRLICDSGTENKGCIVRYVLKRNNINLQVAQIDIPESNSMIESVIKELKRIADARIFDNYHQAIYYFTKAIEIYNKMPRTTHIYLSPEEVYKGLKPDILSLKDLKRKTKQNRLAENREYKCMKTLSCTFG